MNRMKTSFCPFFCISIFLRKKTIQLFHRPFALLLVNVAVSQKHFICLMTSESHNYNLINARLPHIGIPYNYLRKCPQEIQSVQMNYWIEHEKNEQLFARFDGNSVRAIFTPKYKPVDNMDVILEIYGMGYRPETQVQCHLDELFMSLSIMVSL